MVRIGRSRGGPLRRSANRLSHCDNQIFQERNPAAPFGGVKASGIGRELGPEAISAYQQFKSIYT